MHRQHHRTLGCRDNRAPVWNPRRRSAFALALCATLAGAPCRAGIPIVDDATPAEAVVYTHDAPEIWSGGFRNILLPADAVSWSAEGSLWTTSLREGRFTPIARLDEITNQRILYEDADIGRLLPTRGIWLSARYRLVAVAGRHLVWQQGLSWMGAEGQLDPLESVAGRPTAEITALFVAEQAVFLAFPGQIVQWTPATGETLSLVDHRETETGPFAGPGPFQCVSLAFNERNQVLHCLIVRDKTHVAIIDVELPSRAAHLRTESEMKHPGPASVAGEYGFVMANGLLLPFDPSLPPLPLPGFSTQAAPTVVVVGQRLFYLANSFDLGIVEGLGTREPVVHLVPIENRKGRFRCWDLLPNGDDLCLVGLGIIVLEDAFTRPLPAHEVKLVAGDDTSESLPGVLGDWQAAVLPPPLSERWRGMPVGHNGGAVEFQRGDGNIEAFVRQASRDVSPRFTFVVESREQELMFHSNIDPSTVEPPATLDGLRITGGRLGDAWYVVCDGHFFRFPMGQKGEVLARTADLGPCEPAWAAAKARSVAAGGEGLLLATTRDVLTWPGAGGRVTRLLEGARWDGLSPLLVRQDATDKAIHVLGVSENELRILTRSPAGDVSRVARVSGYRADLETQAVWTVRTNGLIVLSAPDAVLIYALPERRVVQAFLHPDANLSFEQSSPPSLRRCRSRLVFNDLREAARRTHTVPMLPIPWHHKMEEALALPKAEP